MNFLKVKAFFLSILSSEYGWTSEMNVTGVAEIDAAIPEYWADGIIVDGNRESFWGNLIGNENSRMPVIEKAGPLKQKGDLLTFNTLAQIMSTGVTGESVLKGNETKLGVGSFTVSADIVRNAIAVSKKSTMQANFDEVKRAQALLTDWMGRKLDADRFNAVLSSSVVDTIYAGDATTASELSATEGDHFGPSEINKISLALQRIGATPLKTGKVNGRSVPVYGCVFGEIENYWLNNNTTFLQTIRESWERFKGANGEHPLFNGAIGIYRNVILYPYYSILPIPQGTPLRPETTLSATLVTAGTTAYVGVAADADALANYTIYFSTTGSLQIEDEVITYTGKSISTFTGLSRAAGGTTAAQHLAGALVTQRDVATVIGFGAGAIYSAMCDSPKPIGQKDDYEAQIGLGIEAYYGQAIRIDKKRGKAASVVMCKVISDNPGTI